MDYRAIKTGIDKAYPELVQEQEMWLKEHWMHFNSEKAKLESIVGEEFGKVIGEIGIQVPHWILSRKSYLVNPEILGYQTVYNPQFKDFRIKITKLKLPGGKIMDDSNVLSSQYGCPHVLLEPICGFSDEIHPRIKSFKEEYSVRDISYPQ